MPGGGDGRERVFVGDVQGCADELDALLEAVGYDPGRHALWCVGDLVNRGPASARVLRRLRELGANSVLGNHDLHLLRRAAGQGSGRTEQGLRDVLEAPDREELLAWLRARPLVAVWDDVLLVHAGVHPHWKDPVAVLRPLEARIAAGDVPRGDPDLDFATRARFCDADGRRPADDRAPGPGFAPWEVHYRGERLVVCGHWAVRGLVRGARIRGIDTGCVYGGRLTAWLAEPDRFVSVPARRGYAPRK